MAAIETYLNMMRTDEALNEMARNLEDRRNEEAEKEALHAEGNALPWKRKSSIQTRAQRRSTAAGDGEGLGLQRHGTRKSAASGMPASLQAVEAEGGSADWQGKGSAGIGQKAIRISAASADADGPYCVWQKASTRSSPPKQSVRTSLTTDEADGAFSAWHRHTAGTTTTARQSRHISIAEEPPDPSQQTYQFPTRPAKRKSTAVAHTGGMTDRSRKTVAAWLSDQEHRVGQGGDASAIVPFLSRKGGYTRHEAPRLTRGSWQDLWVSRMQQLANTIPIINPFTPAKRWWDLFIMVLVMYFAVSVPLDISFGMPTQMHIVDYLEYSIDVVFVIDIIMTFRTAYVDPTGHLVRDGDRIAVTYVKTWFFVDLFATIPYDLLAKAVLRGQVNSTQLTVLKFLKTPRLLRLGRLFRMLDRVKSGNVIRVVVVMAAMVLISHWLACIWYMLYKFTSFADYVDWGIFVGGELQPGQTISLYLSAYYQSFLMMVGNSQIAYNNLERVFMIMVLIMGACFYSAMVGQMAVLVANMNTVALRHRTKQDTTMDVLRYMGLPDKEMARVQAYFSYITQYSHPANEGLSFLTDLPKSLFEELTGHLYRKHLIKVPLFEGLEPFFLSSLAARMRIVTFTPRETIFRAGDLGLEMYVIRKGCVAVIGKHSQHLGILAEGDYFGEIAMFTMAKRTARCVALTNCDLCVLNTYDLKMVMKDFPSSSEALQERAEEKLRQLQVAGRAGFASDDEGDGEEEDMYEDQGDYEEGNQYLENANNSPLDALALQDMPERESPTQAADPALAPKSPLSPPLKARASTISRRSTHQAPDSPAVRTKQSGSQSDAQAPQQQAPMSPAMLDILTHIGDNGGVDGNGQQRFFRSPTVPQTSKSAAAPTQPQGSGQGPTWAPMRKDGGGGGPVGEGSEDVSQQRSNSVPAVMQRRGQLDRSRLSMRPRSGRVLNRRVAGPGPIAAGQEGGAHSSISGAMSRASRHASNAGTNEHGSDPDATWQGGPDYFMRAALNVNGGWRMLQSLGEPSSLTILDEAPALPTAFQAVPNRKSMRSSAGGVAPSMRTSATSGYPDPTSTALSRRSSIQGYYEHSASRMMSRRASTEQGHRRSIETGHRKSTELGQRRSIELGTRRSVEMGQRRSVEAGPQYNSGHARSRASSMGGSKIAAADPFWVPAPQRSKSRHSLASGAPDVATLERMLAVSQQQVETLQQELQAARKASEINTDMRSQLFVQVASLLQLIEELNIRILGLEEGLAATNTQLAKMETAVAPQTGNVLGGVLGTNLETAPSMKVPGQRRKPGKKASFKSPKL